LRHELPSPAMIRGREGKAGGRDKRLCAKWDSPRFRQGNMERDIADIVHNGLTPDQWRTVDLFTIWGLFTSLREMK